MFAEQISEHKYMSEQSTGEKARNSKCFSYETRADCNKNLQPALYNLLRYFRQFPISYKRADGKDVGYSWPHDSRTGDPAFFNRVKCT
jgi:hypothetical protein